MLRWYPDEDPRLTLRKQVIQRSETLDDFLFYYNQVRPHHSLDYEKPMDVFLADLLSP